MVNDISPFKEFAEKHFLQNYFYSENTFWIRKEIDAYFLKKVWRKRLVYLFEVTIKEDRLIFQARLGFDVAMAIKTKKYCNDYRIDLDKAEKYFYTLMHDIILSSAFKKQYEVPDYVIEDARNKSLQGRQRVNYGLLKHSDWRDGFSDWSWV